MVRARAITGRALPSLVQSPFVVFAKMRHLTRVLGHLMHVYCCYFDRTGTRVFTVSLDFLPDDVMYRPSLIDLLNIYSAGAKLICRL